MDGLDHTIESMSFKSTSKKGLMPEGGLSVPRKQSKYVHWWSFTVWGEEMPKLSVWLADYF